MACLLILSENTDLFFAYLKNNYNRLIWNNVNTIQLTAINLMLVHAWLCQSRNTFKDKIGMQYNLSSIVLNPDMEFTDTIEKLCSNCLCSMNTLSFCSFIYLLAAAASKNDEIMSFIVNGGKQFVNRIRLFCDGCFTNYYLPALSSDCPDMKYVDKLDFAQRAVGSEPQSFAIVRACFLALNKVTLDIMEKGYLTQSHDSNQSIYVSLNINDHYVVTGWKIMVYFCAKIVSCVETDQYQERHHDTVVDLKRLIYSTVFHYFTQNGLVRPKFKDLCQNIVIQERKVYTDATVHELNLTSKSLAVIANYLTQYIFRSNEGT